LADAAADRPGILVVDTRLPERLVNLLTSLQQIAGRCSLAVNERRL